MESTIYWTCPGCGISQGGLETLKRVTLPELGEVCGWCGQPHTSFSEEVLRRIEDAYEGNLSAVARVIVKREALALEEEGFSEHDAMSMCLCLEEVNPDLDEETALARTLSIRAKYGEVPSHNKAKKGE